ncbi:V-type ATP synthase subunit F [Candidatus Bathyarchaeota archaeon]|nr:V-type ATP synthase subunit F [Candidatus Bathyarchaeota archaeon]MBS7630355.1 V-type ATP synthase subunit F [Candidatus Bathyarchaeota archaeon]
MSIAVIGSPPFVSCFEMIGAVSFEANGSEAVTRTLKRLIEEENFKLIIIPERFAKETLPLREQVMRKGDITPVFTLIPDLTMETGMRIEELQEIVSLAIGAKLEL